MGKYAQGTAVPVFNSKHEVETILKRYGASGYGVGENEVGAVVFFQWQQRHCKIMVPYPTIEEATKTPTGRTRYQKKAIAAAREQTIRERWRAICLYIKAQFEAIESGIVRFDEAMLSHMVTPDGSTIGEKIIPQLTMMINEGRPPVFGLLPG